MSVTLNLKPLRDLKRGLKKSEALGVKVGLLEETAHRADPNQPTNPEIGFKQEYGSIGEGIPARSFIEMPLTLSHFADAIEPEMFDHIEDKDGVAHALERLGFLGEAVIQEAFDTQGFGTWAPNAPFTVAVKGKNTPLIDTAQMRKAIRSEVVRT